MGRREHAVLRVLRAQQRCQAQTTASTTLRPANEPDLNGGGRFRIDYEVAHPISVARVEKQPWLLKTLSLGTWLDVEVMEALTESDIQDPW